MTGRPVAPGRFYYRITDGIRVTVHPWYAAEESEPPEKRYVHPYRVRIENVSRIPARLVNRHWRITDGDGAITEVMGEGVVGQQPVIPAGGVFEYQSLCVLATPNGTMEGEYQFVRVDGKAFAVAIPRFVLDVGGD